MAGLAQKGHHDEEVKTRDFSICTIGNDSKYVVIKKQLEMIIHKQKLEKVSALMHDVDVKLDFFVTSVWQTKASDAKHAENFWTLVTEHPCLQT